MTMYALTKRSYLPDSWHHRALHHSLQANSMYKFFTFGSLLAMHFLKFAESMNYPFFIPTLYKRLFKHLPACIVILIYIYLSHSYSAIIKTACTHLN